MQKKEGMCETTLLKFANFNDLNWIPLCLCVAHEEEGGPHEW